MEKKYIQSFYVAGLQFYEGSLIVDELKVGKKLMLKAEPTNHYDKNAIEIYRKGVKLGYVPRTENKWLSDLLDLGLGKHFEARVQRINENDHFAHTIKVVVFGVKL